MKFGERLKKARTDLGLTQERVAQELHVSRQTISSWENERSYPDITSLVHLSNYYQLSLDILLKEDNSMVEEISKKEALARVNKIWGISYMMNLIFLAVIVLGQLLKNDIFAMGDGVRVLFLCLMILNVSLLLYVTSEKSKLSEGNQQDVKIKKRLFQFLLGAGVVSLVLGFVLWIFKQPTAAVVLGLGCGITVTLIGLYLLQKKLKQA